MLGSNVVTAALSAVTANTIQGTSPRLKPVVETGIENGDNFELFGIDDGGSTYFTDADIKTLFTGFNLSSTTDTPTILMAKFNAMSYSLAFATPSALQVEDSDGDIFDTIEEKTVGSVTLKWYKAGTNTLLTPAQMGQSFCQLSANGISPEFRAEGAITLKTKYGDPREQDYPDASIGVTETPKRAFNYTDAFVGGAVCYARPNLSYGTGNWAGPANQWDPANGFIPQSSTVYSNNFPTTGAHGLYFDLVLGGGIDATKLTWPGVGATPALSVNGITATVSVTNASTVKIMLTGPVATPAQITALNPGGIVKPTLPAQFVIEGKLGGEVKAEYGFSLDKWYINRGNKTTYHPAQSDWCTGANYRLAHVNELTNARVNGFIIVPAIPYPNPTGNRYWRRIGGGLFSEWGSIDSYSGAGFVDRSYWTYDSGNSGVSYFFVYANSSGSGGEVGSGNPVVFNMAGVCTTP